VRRDAARAQVHNVQAALQRPAPRRDHDEVARLVRRDQHRQTQLFQQAGQAVGVGAVNVALLGGRLRRRCHDRFSAVGSAGDLPEA
jgi:hypothetical protein